MKTTLYILSTAFLFFSCKKEYHVVGKVINPVTGAGMSGVKVEFFTSTGGLPGGFKEVASTLSDGNGNYDLKFKGQAHSVKLDGSSGHYELGSLQNGTYQKVLSLEHKKTQNIDWHVIPYGTLIVHAQNINCQGPNDTLQLFLDGSDLGYDDVQIGMLSENYGCIDITSSSVQFPMGNRYYHWNIIRSGVTTTVHDTIFIQPNQTNTLEIFY